MSSPKRPAYAQPAWSSARLRLACRIRGIPDGAGLWRHLAIIRARGGLPPADRTSVWRWYSGAADPSLGRTGHTSAVFELADALQVSVDWLMGRVKRDPTFTDSTRRQFAGDEGWS